MAISMAKPGALMKKTGVAKGPIATMNQNSPQLTAIRGRLNMVGRTQSMGRGCK